MEEEPVIITLLKADHIDGFHKNPNAQNKYCPLCTEEQLATEVEEFLKEGHGHDSNS